MSEERENQAGTTVSSKLEQNTAPTRLEAMVHGHVQGVGFRAFALRRAASLRVSGYVRNSWDGAVEVVAEGPRTVLEQLLLNLRTGPIGAWVERVETQWGEPTGEFGSFEVRY
jgi:acylphosphatase